MTIEDLFALSLLVDVVAFAGIAYLVLKLRRANHKMATLHNINHGITARMREKEAELATMHRRFDRFDRSKDKKRSAERTQATL